MNSIFLNNVTLVDAAYLSYHGRPIGVSVSPVFLVSGSVSNDEEVVVDFSKCKKIIKDMIDDQENGFDHKLWVDPESNALTGLRHSNDSVHLQTEFLALSVPQNAVRYVPNLTTNVHTFLPYVATEMENFLNERMAYLGVDVQVSIPMPEPVNQAGLCMLYNLNSGDIETESFKYTHGLPKSSSWGCQNILHGHESFVTVGGGDDIGRMDLIERILKFVDGAYLYDETLEGYSIHDGAGEGDFGTSHYYVTARGAFSLSLSHKVQTIGIEGAPTIENITTFVAKTFAKELEAAGVTLLAVSEGLWKGSCIHRPNGKWIDNG